MKKLIRTAALIAAMTASVTAFSLELDAAKAGGLVGEQPSGYLAAVGTPTPEVTALVNDINAKRKTAYQDIARRNGTALDAVEQLAGKKAIEKTPTGQYVRLPSGEWAKVK